jgi:hypothetical protein
MQLLEGFISNGVSMNKGEAKKPMKEEEKHVEP